MYLKLTFIGLLIIVAIDSIYLSLNSSFYDSIKGTQPINITYALMAWLSIIISIQLLVLSRNDIDESNVFINGMFLGLASYSLYNFTNAAMYPAKWSNKIIVGDTLWGMIITGTMSWTMLKVKNNFM